MKNLLYLAVAIIFNVSIASSQTIDDKFNEPRVIRPAKIYSIKVLPNRKLMVGGSLSFLKADRVNNLIRLNHDNTLDKSFKFCADRNLIIRKVGFLSTGDIIVLANFEKQVDLSTDSCVLFRLGQDGRIINRIDTLVNCNSIAIQNDDKILVCSRSISHPGIIRHLYRYNSDFSPDITFNKKVTANDQILDVKVYNNSIYICGTFSLVNDTLEKNIAKLKINGSIDTAFDIGTGTSDYLPSMTFQSDGKILLGETLINVFNGKQYHGLIRLNSNGTVDSGFNPPAMNSPSSEITYRDSSIYLAEHAFVDGPILIKLNYDGSVDTHYAKVNLDAFSFGNFSIGFAGDTAIFNNSTTTGNKFGLSACNSGGQYINSFKPEISRYGDITVGNSFNDKLLIAGDFMKVNDVETFGIAILDKNGVADKNFVLANNLGSVKQVQIVNDSTVFVSTYSSFLKLNASGIILKDFDFKQYTKLYEILKFKVLKDGKIIAADANGIYRLNADGFPDLSFNTGTGINTSSTGLDFDLQDDKIIWGSDFTRFNDTNVNKLIRLKADGSLDTIFKIGKGPDGQIFITKVLDSGEVIAGGWFYKFDGFDTPHQLVKLSKDGGIDSAFLKNQNSSSLNWTMSPYNTKIEQIGKVIFVKNKNSIISLNLNGTVNNDFKFPVIIGNVNDIFSGNAVTAGGKSLSASESGNNLIALGTFRRSVNSDPSFILKLNLDSKPANPALSVSSASINLSGSDNSTSTFNITSNISWDVTSNQTWLSVNYEWGSNNATIVLTASANTSGKPRTAVVTISGLGVQARTVTVIQASMTSSISEIPDTDVKIWPVPVNDRLYISLSGSDKLKYLEIFSSAGLRIYSSKNIPDNSEIDMSNYPAGIYYLRIFTLKQRSLTRKIIKQ